MLDHTTIERAIEFHGHMCPGLAMGIRAGEVCLQEFGAHSDQNQLVAIVETDMWPADGIQSVTGCTFGKRNFIHVDHNQTVATFLRRSDGKAILVTTRPEGWGKPDPEHQSLFAKVRAGTITPEERARFKVLHEARAQMLLEMPLDEIFDVTPTSVELPPKYRR